MQPATISSISATATYPAPYGHLWPSEFTYNLASALVQVANDIVRAGAPPDRHRGAREASSCAGRAIVPGQKS